MKNKNFTRRKIIASMSSGSFAAVASGSIAPFGNISCSTNNADRHAILEALTLPAGRHGT